MYCEDWHVQIYLFDFKLTWAERSDKLFCYSLGVNFSHFLFLLQKVNSKQTGFFFHKYGKNVFSSRGQCNYIINFYSCFLWPFFFSESKCRFAQACLHGNAIILKFYFFYLKVKFWSQQISFLLIGIIIVTSIRGLLITLTRVRMYKKTFTLCTQASLICLSAFIHVCVCPLNHYSSIYHHFTHSKPSLIFQFIYLVFIPLSVQDFTHLSIHRVFSISLSIQPLLIFLSTQSLLICISNQPSFYVYLTFTHLSVRPVLTH